MMDDFKARGSTASIEDSERKTPSYVLAELPIHAVGKLNENYHVTSNGVQFELRMRESCASILLESDEALPDVFDQILEYLDVDSDWLTWINPDVRLVAYEVWRQDDNGNTFIVRITRCGADARRMIRRLESVPHKQTYWIRRKLAL
jgi:hypothetical protein